MSKNGHAFRRGRHDRFSWLAAIRYHEVDLLQGKEVVEKALVEFCAVAKKNVQLGFAEKSPFDRHVIIVKLHGALLGAEACAGEKEDVRIHLLDGTKRHIPRQLVPG